jgi:sulfotransferase
LSGNHFIAGLPRSGSTLLAAILRQNPRISAGISSPACNIFQAVQKAASHANEGAMFINDEQRASLLRHTIADCHDGNDVVFDTNRAWPSKLPLLGQLFPDCRIICCVREVAWVVDSFERVIAKHPVNTSGLFQFEPGNTVYQRVHALTQPGGLVGTAHNALKEGYFGPHAARLLLIEYDALARQPKKAIDAVYEFLDLSAYRHDFGAIDQIPGADRYDREKLGTPGLHAVGSRVEWHDRQTVLPPDVFASFPPPFWRQGTPLTRVVSYS